MRDATLLIRNKPYPSTFIPIFNAISVLPPIAPPNTSESRRIFMQYPTPKYHECNAIQPRSQDEVTMWIYEGNVVSDAVVPEKAIGFVYLISHKHKDMLYLGRKLLTKAGVRQVAGKKIKVRKPSDWENYWGSSPSLLAILEEEGTDNFQREILCFTFSKAETNYLEESLQYKLDVLVNDRWINNNIRAKVFRKNVSRYQCHKKAEELVHRFSS